MLDGRLLSGTYCFALRLFRLLDVVLLRGGRNAAVDCTWNRATEFRRNGEFSREEKFPPRDQTLQTDRNSVCMGPR